MALKITRIKLVKIPHKSLIIASVFFAILIFIIGIVVFRLALKTQNVMIDSQKLSYTPPTTPIKTQVKRVLLKREGLNGIEYIEILMDGTINLYDANMKLIKRGLQGYGRVNSVLDDLAKHFDQLESYLNGNKSYTITIDTNHGTYVFEGNGNGGGGNNTLDDIVDEIEDVADDTFTPTPTPRPTFTPPAVPPTITLTPNPYFSPTPQPFVTPNPLTPTPLPGYMTAPPFTCEDYQFSRPTTISNIICVPTTAP